MGHGINGPWQDRSALTADSSHGHTATTTRRFSSPTLAARKLAKRLSNRGPTRRILDLRSPYDRTNKQAGRRL